MSQEAEGNQSVAIGMETQHGYPITNHRRNPRAPDLSSPVIVETLLRIPHLI